MKDDRSVQNEDLENRKKQEIWESDVVREAKKQAEMILRQAEENAREIHGSSLFYVDDMLAEVSLAAKRARESVRIIMEQTMEDLNRTIDIIEANQKEILEDLREMSENGNRPVRRADYEIKIDENYRPKQGYQVKINDSEEERVAEYRPAKQPYEIKIADEWKDRIEKMLENTEQPYEEELPEPEPEEEEEEEGFKASDFDLDAEYFDWLSQKDET